MQATGDQDLLEEWIREQNSLKQKLKTEDVFPWGFGNGRPAPRYIGGMDISFIKGNDVDACATMVVLSYPELMVVYEHFTMVQLTQPYIPGFLAFREAPFLVDEFNILMKTQPELKPDVVMVDGNGVLHSRGFGLASHLGVLLDVPTVGVGKTFFNVDGLTEDFVKKEQVKLQKSGYTFPLRGASGTIWGMALRSTPTTTNPIFVSVGHSICLATAVTLVHACCRYRVPEPIRQADTRSREYLRKLLANENAGKRP